MKIVLTGSQGQVGAAIIHANAGQHDIVALTHQTADITDPDCINTLIQQHQPDIVINAAAYTAVDQAEKQKDLATAVNVYAAKQLAHVCATQSIPLLHYSTDYVFAGEPGNCYQETSSVAPCNHYGHTKLLGEQMIQQTMTHYIILRVSAVFAADGHNFIRAILRAAKTQTTLRVVADQYASPTSANAIAVTSLQLANAMQQPDCAWGIYHYTGAPFITWHELAEYCVAQARHYTTLAVQEIVPITTAEYAAPAPRPLHPQLDCQKIYTQFAITQPDWHSAVDEMIKRLYADNVHT